ncbi:MAG: dienelactone hydrolase family protein [Chloroflexaceae bacterium]
MDRVYVMQLVRSFQCGQITRREFLTRAAAALGSMAAATTLLAACGQPGPTGTGTTPPPVVDPTATTATTADAADTDSTEGLITEEVTYPDADGATLTGYLARPEGADPLPAVVVIQEWWGLNEHIRDVTRRFAQQGFVALAPDLYDGQVVTEPDEARKLVMELDMMEAVAEIRQGIDFLQQQEYVAGEAVGVVGFCMGGGLALNTARAEEDLGAAVAFYGRPLAPEEAQEVQVPVLGLYGAEDQGIPVDEVRQMQSALEEAGVKNEFQVYPGAGHAFFNDTRDSYAADAAADAWERTLAWFRTHLPAA